MKQNSKEDIVKKWAPILDIGLTGSKDDCMPELAELNPKQEIVNSKTEEEFPSLLPIVMKVAAKTIGQDLVFASKKEIDEVKNKVLTENRDGKIEAIVYGKEFTEKKLEDDIDYQKLIKKGVTPISAPSGHLFYLDFKYDIHKKTRRSGRKKKKNNGSL